MVQVGGLAGSKALLGPWPLRKFVAVNDVWILNAAASGTLSPHS
jgi:hypothetical protein